MAHVCPSCFETAPLLFRFCPECDFDMILCTKMNCDHCMLGRNKMRRDAKQGINVAAKSYHEMFDNNHEKNLQSLMAELHNNPDNMDKTSIITDISEAFYNRGIRRNYYYGKKIDEMLEILETQDVEAIKQKYESKSIQNAINSQDVDI